MSEAAIIFLLILCIILLFPLSFTNGSILKKGYTQG